MDLVRSKNDVEVTRLDHIWIVVVDSVIMTLQVNSMITIK